MFLINNIVWPALYYLQGISAAWYLILISLLTEFLLLKLLLSIPYKIAFLSTFTANLLSSLIGINLVVWGMFYYWHPIMDQHVPGATFGFWNFIATWGFLWLASFILEYIVMRIWFRKSQNSIKLLWVIALINLVSYFITINLLFLI